ncbi:MAG: hypothetical protein K8H86_04380 [Ignavibacteriaceae bacterium]|nr:hypothetical protein [Ignavibacteriaceae bacterium]
MQETGRLGRFSFYLFILFLVFSSWGFNYQDYPETEMSSLMKRGIDNLINQEFDKAAEDFEKVNKHFPLNPIGKIFLAANEIARSYDQASEYNSDFILSNLNKAIDQAEELVDKDKNNVWNVFVLALAEGHYAYFKGLDGNWLSAFSNGLNSVSDFEKCIKIDSTFYDAYTAIGAYKYWKSRKTEAASWLPFIDDERIEGIRMLEKALAQSSPYSSYMAAYTLQWIYIDRREYKNAIRISEDITKKYPNSRFFKWGYARAYEDVEPAKSIELYKWLLHSYMNDDNVVQVITLKHIIAQQYYKINDIKSTLSYCNEILSYKGFTEFQTDKLEDRLERVKALRDSLSKK